MTLPRLDAPLLHSSRFQFHRLLGAGGFGVVYAAYDQVRKGPVAVKLLRNADAATLYRFKREFRALSGLTHRNLVTLYELFSEGSQWYFTMELVDGQDFLGYVREGAPAPEVSDEPEETRSARPGSAPLGALGRGDDELATTQPAGALPPSPAVDLPRLHSALLQLAHGIEALHAAGKLHRDIKPANIRVTPEGRLVLLDFGLVTDLTSDQIAQSVDLAGTPGYLSPEQAAGIAATPASDWYAVGVMLYEVLSGRLPFQGTPLRVLVDKQQQDPPPVESYAPGLPPVYAALCQDLLRRDPAARPNAAEVLRRLQAAGPQPAPSVQTPPAPPPPAALELRPPGRALLGRERQLQALRDALRLRDEGRTVVVRVLGRFGMGKTALVQRFLEEQQDRAVTLTGRCYEQESVPYKALDSLVDQLSRHLSRLSAAELASLRPRHAAALTQLFPVLAAVPGLSLKGGGLQAGALDPAELRRRAFAALRELLARLADGRPLILCIDDLQWSDADSAAALRAILLPPDAPRLLLLASCRSDEAASSPVMQALWTLPVDREDPVRFRNVVVAELPEAEGQALALQLLPAGRGEQAEAERAAKAAVIARESGGNPYLLGLLARRPAPLSSSQAPPPRAALQERETLRGLLRLQIAALPDPARRLLQVTAVAGQPIDIRHAAAAAALGDEELAALNLLRGALLLRQSGSAQELVEVYHDRIREAALLLLSEEEQAALHRRLAELLGQAGDADDELLALHCERGGLRAQAVALLTNAATEADEVLAFDRAARLYQRALSLCGEDAAEATVLHQRLAEALAKLGRGRDAGHHYLQAAVGLPQEEALALRQQGAAQFLLSGELEAGHKTLWQVLEAADVRPQRSRLRALLMQLGWLLLYAVWPLRPRLREEAALPAPLRARLPVIDRFSTGAVGLTRLDPLQGGNLQGRHLWWALRVGEPRRLVRALAWETFYRGVIGHSLRRGTRARIALLLHLAESAPDPATVATARMGAGAMSVLLGDFAAGVAQLDQAAALLRERCVGMVLERSVTDTYAAVGLLWQGDGARLRERLPGLLHDAAEREDLFSVAWLRTYQARLLLWADDLAGARRQLDEVAALPVHSEALRCRLLALRVALAQYEDDRRAGATLWTELREAHRRSVELRFFQLGRVEVLAVEAGAALWLATGAAAGERAGLLREARALLRRLRREGAGYAVALWAGLSAGLCSEGERRLRLLDAVRAYESSGLGLHEQLLRWLLASEAERGAAEARLRERGVAQPRRLAGLLLPGPQPQ